VRSIVLAEEMVERGALAAMVSERLKVLVEGATDWTGLTVAMGLLGVMGGAWLGGGGFCCLGAEGIPKKLVIDC